MIKAVKTKRQNDVFNIAVLPENNSFSVAEALHVITGKCRAIEVEIYHQRHYEQTA